MTIKKTDKIAFTDDDIIDFVVDYRSRDVPVLERYWEYYKGKDSAIMERQTPDPNNPDNKVPVPYARKIVSTYSGYAFRPKYITYRPKKNETDMEDEVALGEGMATEAEEAVAEMSAEDMYVKELQDIFDKNSEHIKTSRAGRNTAIFGVSYEILYAEAEAATEKERQENPRMLIKAMPRFITVDPREMVLIYDYSPEPRKVMGIRFQKVDSNTTRLEIYQKDKVTTCNMVSDQSNPGKYRLADKKDSPNFYDDVPIVAYYLNDEIDSIFACVIPLIDANDVLFSDSMNEMDRFAYAYLVMKKFGLTDPTIKKEPGKFAQMLQLLKRRRVFEFLPADADIKFLTKDIPTGFIEFMAKQLREQIHVQSHVPDFTSEKFAAGISGEAIRRLLFDFENLVATAEADFDEGLYDRIRLISGVLTKLGRSGGSYDMVVIDHKRNMPLNLKEYADSATAMRGAGFSMKTVLENMPDDMIPDVDEELRRQEIERQKNLEAMNPYSGYEDTGDDEGNAAEGEGEEDMEGIV
jgi:SPP1 family phage portal protein